MSSVPQNQTPVYSEFGDDPEMSELVEFFVSQVPERLQSFREAEARNDLEELCRLAHQLKGASGSYGFYDLSSQAAALESILKQSPQPDEISIALDAFLAVYEHISVGTAG